MNHFSKGNIRIKLGMAINDQLEASDFEGLYCEFFNIRVKAGTLSQFFMPSICVYRRDDVPGDCHFTDVPVLLADVMKPFDSPTDYAARFLSFKSIGTLGHYILVSLNPKQVIHIDLLPTVDCRATVYHEGDTLTLDKPKLSLSIAQIFSEA